MPSHMRPIACEKSNADSNNNLSCFHLSHELDTASINCSSASPAQPMCSNMHIKETMQRDNDQAIKSLAHVLRGMLEEQSLSLHANADWESQYPLDQTMINIIGGENNTNGDVFSPALAPHNQLEEYVNELVPALQLINKTTHNLDLKQRQEAIKLTADAVLARRATGMAWSSALSNRLGTYNINNNPINETQIHGVTGMFLEDPDFVNAMECASSDCIKTPVSSEGNSCENAFSDDFGAFGSSLASSEHSSMVDSTSDLNMDDHDGLNYVQSDDKCPAMEIRSNSEAQRSVISELVMDNYGSNHFQSYPLYEEINAEFRHRSCESNGVVQWASNSMESSGLISAPVSDVMEVRRLERESMSGYARASMDKSADGLTGGRLVENVMGQYSCSINGGNPCAGADISVGNPCVNAENTEDSAPWERLHAAGIIRAKLDAANVLMKVGKPSPAGNMSSSGEGDGGATAVSPQNGSSLLYGMKARNADMEVSVLSYHGTAEVSDGMHAGDDGLEAARGMAADGMEGEEKEEEDMQGSQNAALSMTMMYGGSSCDDHGHHGGLTSMREAVYTLSAYQPIDWSSVMQEGSKERPKRRNVRVSKDPQSVAARRRRERISDRIRILQRLVPGGAKLDTASMLDEAIQYLKFLKMQVQALGRLERYFTSLPQPAHHAYYRRHRHHHLNAAAPPLPLHHVQI